jgi:hypothetical protein
MGWTTVKEVGRGVGAGWIPTLNHSLAGLFLLPTDERKLYKRTTIFPFEGFYKPFISQFVFRISLGSPRLAVSRQDDRYLQHLRHPHCCHRSWPARFHKAGEGQERKSLVSPKPMNIISTT